MAQKLICTSCGYIGSSHRKVKGNVLIEIILWLSFLIPGIIYSIWRSSSGYSACQSCGGNNMIPVNTPVGQKLLKDQGRTLEEFKDNSKEIGLPNIKGKTVIKIIGVCMVIILWAIYASYAFNK